MSSVNAWLLELGEGLIAAVGDLEMVHVLLEKPTLFEIPHSPDYCNQVLIWQGRILPFMNLALRLLGRSVLVPQEYVIVTAYQAYPGAEIHYGALLLHAPPIQIQVNDSMACQLPESPSGWQSMADSCFAHFNTGPIPVLDLNKVFSTPV